jgi:hypothetical protein
MFFRAWPKGVIVGSAIEPEFAGNPYFTKFARVPEGPTSM